MIQQSFQEEKLIMSILM